MPIPIIARLFGNDDHNDVPHRIYGTVVAQARNSSLYTDFAIPDTVMGRYNMLALHVFLLNHRLKQPGGGDENRCARLSQSLFDLFLGDVERGLRDLGFADTSVHKRKKRFAHSYYALIDEFDKALGNGDCHALVPRVAKRYFEKSADSSVNSHASDLTFYIQKVVQYLLPQSNQAILSGTISWPPIDKAAK
jgi:cytochrome b pre-mRNA-processing protein 3